MLNPASAFVRACKLIVDVIMFFVEKGSQIAELVNAVLDSVEAIADGAIGVAAKLVEGALAKALPVVIGFLASLIGLGGISGKIQDLIKKARGLIDSAVNWVLSKALAFVKKLGGRLGLGRNNSNRPDQRTEAQKKEDLRAALSKSDKLLRDDKISLEGVKKRLPAIKDKHKLVSLNTPDIFLNGSTRLSELMVQGSSYFFKVSSASDLEKRSCPQQDKGLSLKICSNFVRSIALLH